MVSMKKHLIFSMPSVVFFAFASPVSAGSDPAICKQLSDQPGIYYVGKDASDVQPTSQKLSSGKQRINWHQRNWIYFVVGENDGRPETVDHFRLMTFDPRKSDGPVNEVGLDRSAVNTNRLCMGALEHWLSGYGNQQHYATNIKFYDKRTKPENRNIDSINLNPWHFQWNNGTKESVTCRHTAGFVPTIQDENPPAHVSPVLKENLLIAAAVAKGLGLETKLSQHLAALSMVLVHRKENENACLGVSLSFGAMPEQTKINRLRFSKQREQFSTNNMTINWEQ
jgi:hypothetical protein